MDGINENGQSRFSCMILPNTDTQPALDWTGECEGVNANLPPPPFLFFLGLPKCGFGLEALSTSRPAAESDLSATLAGWGWGAPEHHQDLLSSTSARLPRVRVKDGAPVNFLPTRPLQVPVRADWCHASLSARESASVSALH